MSEALPIKTVTARRVPTSTELDTVRKEKGNHYQLVAFIATLYGLNEDEYSTAAREHSQTNNGHSLHHWLTGREPERQPLTQNDAAQDLFDNPLP